MTDDSGVGGQRREGESNQALIETILEDVVRAASMPEHDWQALSPFSLPPLAIPVSADRQYRVTQVGVDAAHQLTDQVWQEREDYPQTIQREAFDCLSFNAIGQAIRAAHTRLLTEAENADESVEHESVFYEEPTADFKTIPHRLAGEVRVDVDRHIPCTLFHEDQLVPAFAVGPVEFLPRAAVAANVRRFLRVIRARKRWQVRFGMGLAPDSNIGTSPGARIIMLDTAFGRLPFTLNEPAREESGVGVSVWTGGEYQHPLGDRWRLRTGGDLFRRDYKGGDFDRMTLSAHAGPRWLIDQRTEASLLLDARRHRSGGKGQCHIDAQKDLINCHS